MKKKGFLMLSCIAAVAIVSVYSGIKAYQPHAKDCENMLLQNVEALAASGDNDGDVKKYHHKETQTIPCGEEIHYITVSEKESKVCYDTYTMTIESCWEEGGIFTCKDPHKDVKHNVIGSVIY
jgi:hypothetical protein